MTWFPLWLACTVASPPTPETEGVAPVAPVPTPSPAEAKPSLYELDVSLRTADGRTVPLGVHGGHPTLVSMFYADCESACPMLAQSLRSFEASLDAETRAELRVLLVSLDPARDDAAALTGAAERFGADPARWLLTAPPPDRVREVAAVLGIQYRPAADGEIHHTSAMVLVDGDGRVVARSDGPQGSVDALRTALSGLVAAGR